MTFEEEELEECGIEELYSEYRQEKRVPQILPEEAELEAKYPNLMVQFYGEEGYRIHGEAIDKSTGKYIARVKATTKHEVAKLLDSEIRAYYEAGKPHEDMSTIRMPQTTGRLVENRAEIGKRTRASRAQLEKLIDDVPDVNNTAAINYWVTVGDEEVYLEGWCDKCLAGTGYPPMEGGETSAKLAYMKDMTAEILPRKAREKGLELIEGGFIELEEAENLYGVTYGVYRKIKEINDDE